MENQERLTRALADRYSVEGEIGSGGMATVYLAQDLKHERNVAVKVLRPELAATLGSERFLREIKITAGLSHPHILPLLDSGEADSFLFYVMPYVDGESLRKRMDREGEFGTEDSLRIAEQVGSALAYAHSRDIVHRDIKPENILLQEDQVAIADFGIALAVDSAGGDRLTETGLSIGTPAYMSPEQVAGEKEIDARSDIYSLGCVLYEMLAGDPPFTASNSRAVLAKHLTDPAPPVTTVRPGVGNPVAAAIARALEKAPADRFESAKAFMNALSSKSLAEEKEQASSIVVLPFDNLSTDPENSYFCDGLTEEIITHLSYIQSLRVISRNSAMVLKGTRKSTRAIAEELDVKFVLEGSVRKAGRKLRITAQLIDAISDQHLWAGKYDGVLEDVFDLQEEVSRSIVESLELSASPNEYLRRAERTAGSVQAYECFLKAREEWSKFTEEGLALALRIIQNGINVLGENELLCVGLGTVYSQYIHFGSKKDERYLQKAEECVEKVFSFNPDSARGHYIKGFIEWWRGNPKGAVAHLKSSLAIDPNDSDSLQWLGWMYAISGRGSAAYPLFEKAKRVDPLNSLVFGYSSGCHFLDGDFEAAVEGSTKIFQMDPRNPWFQVYQAFTLAYGRRFDEAHQVLDLLIRGAPQSQFGQLGVFLRHALRGEAAEASLSVTEELKAAMEWNEFYPLLMADCYAMIDEKEETIDWLEEAVRRGCVHYPFLNEHDPFLEVVRGEERFKILLGQVKHDWETFEV